MDLRQLQVVIFILMKKTLQPFKNAKELLKRASQTVMIFNISPFYGREQSKKTLLFSLEIAGSKAERKAKAALMHRFSGTTDVKSYPSQLSGDKAKSFVSRALANDPEVLL